MNPQDLQERANRLREIKDEILELVGEAESLVRGTSQEGFFGAYVPGNIYCGQRYCGKSALDYLEEIIEDLESEAQESEGGEA